MLGCSLTGESVGRQLGTHRAKVILQKDLPHSSALRHMLKEQFPDTVAPTALTGPSLDGAELQEVPVTGGNSTSSRPVSPSTAPVSPSNSPWDQVRKQAGPPPSIWDQIRNGQQPVTPPSPGLDQQDVDDLIMEMNSDSKSNSASVSAPSSSKLRTKGESGLIPRTLEEMQEAEKAGTVKRNKYGDIME